jgi:hypothetical protein
MIFGLSKRRAKRFESEAVPPRKLLFLFFSRAFQYFITPTTIMTVTTPLALTTTFSPPPDCFTDTWYIEYVTGEYYYTTSISNSLEGWYLSQGPTNWRTCFPSGYEATTDFYYSPGVCPSGYSIAKSSVLSIGVSSETRATCCPS